MNRIKNAMLTLVALVAVIALTYTVTKATTTLTCTYNVAGHTATAGTAADVCTGLSTSCVVGFNLPISGAPVPVACTSPLSSEYRTATVCCS